MFLINTVETYRMESLHEVKSAQKNWETDSDFEFGGCTYTPKIDKKTDEEYYVVKVKKIFNNEKCLNNLLLPSYVAEEFSMAVEGE